MSAQLDRVLGNRVAHFIDPIMVKHMSQSMIRGRSGAISATRLQHPRQVHGHCLWKGRGRAISGPGSAPGIIFILVAGLWACGPRVVPEGPGAGPEAQGPTEATPGVRAARPASPPMHEALVGEMCPQAASGRPGVLPMIVRTLTWSNESEDVSAPIERRGARQFSILSWDGRRAGLFSVAGAADVGLDRQVASGAYAGVSPCSKPSRAGGGEFFAECVEALDHCGLAVAFLERASGMDARPFEEDPEPRPIAVGGACVEADKLVVDIDGDGLEEAYAAASFLDPIREPADEVLAVPRDAVQCTPAFARRHVIPAEDPKHWRGLDLLGVLDLDGDGRKELVMAYHYSEHTTWAVFSAVTMTGRLDLVGEAVAWSLP